MATTSSPPPFRSALIALIGRPNSGKSSLLNTIIGEEISIVSSLPQTTRSNARGIYTTATMQLVFIDTPGVHFGKHTLNRAMLRQVRLAASDDVDLIVYLVDLSRDYAGEEREVAKLVGSVKSAPVLIVFNKIDLVPSVDEAVGRFHRTFPDLSALPSVRLSATRSDAKKLFLAAANPFIPEGPRYYDPEEMTDSTMRQIAAEYIRKQIIVAAGEEVPHAAFVEIESYRESSDRHHVTATIHVETRGQRGIIIGKGGSVITRIKKDARKELAKIAGSPVSLTCHVKVSPHWRDNDAFLRSTGASLLQ